MVERSPKSLANPVAAALALTCFSLWFMWPVLRHAPNTLYIGSSLTDAGLVRLLANDPAATIPHAPDAWGVFAVGDTLRSVYTLTWWTHVLAGGTGWRSPYDGNTLHPTPQSLAYADFQIGVVPWFAPTYFATGNPVLAYNLALFVGVLGGGLGFFFLLRSWTGSQLAGLVAAVASIVVPVRVGQMSLVYLQFIAYLPLAFVCVDTIVAGRRVWLASFGLALCVALQASSSGYLAYVCTLLLPLYCAGVLVEERTRVQRRAVSALLVAGIAAAGLLAWLCWPLVQQATGGAFGAPQENGAPAHNPWLSLLWSLPGANLRQHLLWNCGIPVVLLAAVGLSDRTTHRRWTLLAIVLTGAVLALGSTAKLAGLTIPLPWEALARVLPGFTVQRHPYLTTTLVAIGMIGLAGLGAARLAQQSSARWVWLVIVLSAGWSYEWQLAALRTVQVATGERIPEVYRWLAAHGEGAPLLELPNPLPTNPLFAYYSTYHWLPVFNGSFTYAPPGYPALAEAAGRVMDSAAEAATFLRQVPIRWVVVHTDLLEPSLRIRQPPAGLTEVARFGADVLYRASEVVPPLPAQQ